jgi:glycosyltransferase involved in cell wall biosynthesis
MFKLSSTSILGVNVIGHISGETGLGEAVRGNIKAMQATGIPYSLQNFKQDLERNLDHTYTDYITKKFYPINYIHTSPGEVSLVSEQLGSDYFKDQYNIAFWAWELLKFPDCWHSAFDLFDEIWTPSNYCVEALAAVSPIPVIKIPHSIDLPIPTLDRASLGLPQDKFIFLFMFDFGSNFERKNPLATLEAFKQAFGTSNQDVLLVIKFRPHPHLLKEVEYFKEQVGDYPSIHVIEGDMTKTEVNSLIYNCDCYVSLHRSEGFGLTMAEAMFYGKPVIATPYSANIDFMNVSNSFPVKYQLITTTQNYGPYPGGSIWADPDIDHAASLMQYAFYNYQEARQIGLRASEDIKSLLSPQTNGIRIRNRLEYIMKWMGKTPSTPVSRFHKLQTEKDVFYSQSQVWKQTAQEMRRELKNYES